MIERRTIRFEHELLAELELPCFEASGRRDGPHLVHRALPRGEYSSISAVVRFMNALDTNTLAGRITAVPIVSIPSFRARTAFVVPQDGKNLNRCFPGSYEGTFSDVLARHVFDELIAPSDVMLDLHGGDMVEALEPFALYDESPVEEQARALAIAFDLPYVVRSAPADAPISGTTTSAAAAAGCLP
jgi:predicted deacylase